MLHDEHVIRVNDLWVKPNKAIWPETSVVLDEALRSWLLDIYPLAETPTHVMTLFTYVTGNEISFEFTQ